MLRICKLDYLFILAFVFLVHIVATMFLSLQNWLNISFKVCIREYISLLSLLLLCEK